MCVLSQGSCLIRDSSPMFTVIKHQESLGTSFTKNLYKMESLSRPQVHQVPPHSNTTSRPQHTLTMTVPSCKCKSTSFCCRKPPYASDTSAAALQCIRTPDPVVEVLVHCGQDAPRINKTLKLVQGSECTKGLGLDLHIDCLWCFYPCDIFH